MAIRHIHPVHSNHPNHPVHLAQQANPVSGQSPSGESNSGYPLTAVFMIVAGFVLIAINKSIWSIVLGGVLAFAGFLAPFYKDKLRNFIQHFR